MRIWPHTAQYNNNTAQLYSLYILLRNWILGCVFFCYINEYVLLLPSVRKTAKIIFGSKAQEDIGKEVIRERIHCGLNFTWNKMIQRYCHQG